MNPETFLKMVGNGCHAMAALFLLVTALAALANAARIHGNFRVDNAAHNDLDAAVKIAGDMVSPLRLDVEEDLPMQQVLQSAAAAQFEAPLAPQVPSQTVVVKKEPVVPRKKEKQLFIKYGFNKNGTLNFQELRKLLKKGDAKVTDTEETNSRPDGPSVNSTASTRLPRHGPSGPAGSPSFGDLRRMQKEAEKADAYEPSKSSSLFIISAAVVFIFAAVVFFLGAWMMWLVPATRRIEHLEFLVGHFQKLLRESDRAHDAAQSVLLAERMAERARYSHYSRPLLEFVSQGLLMEAGEDDRLEQFALDRAVDAGELRLELLNFLRDGLARGFPSPMLHATAAQSSQPMTQVSRGFRSRADDLRREGAWHEWSS